jgi:hypothetical protein
MEQFYDLMQILAQGRLTAGKIEKINALRDLFQRLERDLFLRMRWVLSNMAHRAFRIASVCENNGYIHSSALVGSIVWVCNTNSTRWVRDLPSSAIDIGSFVL